MVSGLKSECLGLGVWGLGVQGLRLRVWGQDYGLGLGRRDYTGLGLKDFGGLGSRDFRRVRDQGLRCHRFLA